MRAVLHVSGPREAGPGERFQMLRRTEAAFEEAGIDDVIRVDVVGRGEEGAGVLDTVIPALQSGSLFGGRRGILIVDAQNLGASDAGVLADLLGGLDAESVLVVLVSAGSLPSALAKVVRAIGDRSEVKRLRERDASSWLRAELRDRRIHLDDEAVAALLQRFGSDLAGMAQAVDQLSATDGHISKEAVLERFRNRPDEPMWHYLDAVAAGDTGASLRRLADFLTHGHPLVLLAFLENDLRKRALAAASEDIESFAEAVNSTPDHYTIRKVWNQRNRTSQSELRSALDALARADAMLKSAPEEIQRVTLERLTVALCRWYGGVAQRVG